MANNSSLGQYLNSARSSAGLSIRQLAERSGVAKTMIGRLLQDQVRRPRSSDLTRIAEALDLPALELYERAGYSIPSDERLNASLRAEYDLSADEIAHVRHHIEAIVSVWRRGITRIHSPKGGSNGKHKPHP